MALKAIYEKKTWGIAHALEFLLSTATSEFWPSRVLCCSVFDVLLNERQKELLAFGVGKTALLKRKLILEKEF